MTQIIAGIDEAGYGPLFGPLVVGCAGIQGDAVCPEAPDAPAIDLWDRLSAAVTRDKRDKLGRLAVDDSKKLHKSGTKVGPAGVSLLERGCLAWTQAASGAPPAELAGWLALLDPPAPLPGEPWYAADERPWDALPVAADPSDIGIAANRLRRACESEGVTCLPLAAHGMTAGPFNQACHRTRSKARASYELVARHIQAIWDRHATLHPWVVIDRQSGRTHYRELLSQQFPDSAMRVVTESTDRSIYVLDGPGDRGMTLRFEVKADATHLPVALASMTAKYTRELLMHRFNAWFTTVCPDIKPTAGYGADGKRFWHDIQPRLESLGIDAGTLRRWW